MKKFLTLVLALVMVLAIAAPAMAFTSDSEAAADIPYELDIYLVEYDDNDLFGLATLPPTDRGYAKNEIVAAVVELYVPKGNRPYNDGYEQLIFDGEDVSLNVTENMFTYANAIVANNPGIRPVYSSANKDMRASLANAADLYNASKNVTYKWLFYAKVTGDEASLSATLVDGKGVGSSFNGSTLWITLDGIEYTIQKSGFTSGSAGQYLITVDEGDYAGAGILMHANKNHVSDDMAIATSSSAPFFTLGFTKSGAVGVYDVNGILKTSGSFYEEIMDVYEDVVVDVFGLDFNNIGNYLRDSFFTGLTSGDTITATVEIKPWTAYVTVPENIVVDPPKTGDAASIVGFVMIVLAAAAAVVVKKVRA